MAGIFGLLMSGAGVIKDQYFNLTSLLLPGNGTNGAQNNTFLDSGTANSGSGFTITRNGNTTQGTFSPFSQTGWGNYFNGSSYLSLSNGAVLAAGTSNFTAEFWVYATTDQQSQVYGSVFNVGDGTSGSFAISLLYSSAGAMKIRFGTLSAEYDSTSTISTNRWYHIAVVREGTGSNQAKMYVDGSLFYTFTLSDNLSNTSGLYVGSTAFNISVRRLSGYVSNLRYTVGTALYTGAFTPSTSPLTTTSQGATASQVELLTCQNNRFLDNSSNGWTFTTSGSPSVTPFSPFAPTQSYSASAVGGSGYFDGTGDFLEAGTTSSFNFMHNTTATFTFQGWIYPLALPGSGSISTLFSTIKDSSTVGVGIYLVYSSSSVASLGVGMYRGVGGSPVIEASGTALIRANTWQHVAVTYDQSLGSANAKFYIDGVAAGTATKTANTPSSSNSTYVGNIGRIPDPTAFTFNGYISNLRIDNSVQTISVPTAPLSTISGTQLLLNFTNAGVVDATAKNVLETVGNAQISTSVSKFGGGSISFDGTSNTGLKAPTGNLFTFGSGAFTIEFWVRFNSVAADQMVLNLTGTTIVLAFYVSATGTLSYYLSSDGSTWNIVSGALVGSISTGQWYRVALVRSGNTFTPYLNTTAGTPTTSSAALATPGSGTFLHLGMSNVSASNLSGYLDDVRVTRGVARDMTVLPTAPFPVQ